MKTKCSNCGCESNMRKMKVLKGGIVERFNTIKEGDIIEFYGKKYYPIFKVEEDEIWRRKKMSLDFGKTWQTIETIYKLTRGRNSA